MGQGGVFLEGSFAVNCGNQQVGKVCVHRKGLYYRFSCRCRLTGTTVCRLWVQCGEKQENLGILVPMGDGFGLDTEIPSKRIGEGEPEFRLTPKHERSSGNFVPVYPEEPFAYISRLKEAYLIRKNGELGIMLK